MLMSDRASKIKVGTYMSRDEARTERIRRKNGAGAEGADEKWFWHYGRGDYVQEDPLYKEGIETCELERLCFNDELSAKVDSGELTWEEFTSQRKPAPIQKGAVSAAQGPKVEEVAGETTETAQGAQSANKCLSMSLKELKDSIYH